MNKFKALIIPILCVFVLNSSFAWPPEKQFWSISAWFKTIQGKEVGLDLNNVAPDIKMGGIDGKEISLYSLRGKVVLIDFWASWCGPCRYENPHVVEAYDKYKGAKFKNGKGFEVFSVSLDAYKDAWVNAIEKDQLKWKYHVCDFKKWSSDAAKLYKINSIPSNILIDGNGVIIGKNLRGIELHKALDAVVEKM